MWLSNINDILIESVQKGVGFGLRRNADDACPIPFPSKKGIGLSLRGQWVWPGSHADPLLGLGSGTAKGLLF